MRKAGPMLSVMFAAWLVAVPACGREPSSAAPAVAAAGGAASAPASAVAPASPVSPESTGEPGAAGAAELIDSQLPVYKAVPGIGGSLRSVGSDTMLNLVQLWSQAFARAYPSVQPQVEGKGSSTAPPALLENQSQIAPMSRPMSPEEIDRFVEKFGYEPTELEVAVDCVAVYVHRDNPIGAISLPQLRRAFSVAGPDMTWADLGVTDAAWASRPVSLYGRNSSSGTYVYFKKAALENADFKASVKDNPGSSGVVNAISKDPAGLGYSGIGYRTPDVKVIPVSVDEGEPAFEPTVANAYAGDYPMARFLFVYLNYDARQPLDPLREQFVRLIYSREGQEAVLKDGAYPVTAEIAREQLAKLRLEPNF